MWSVSDDALVAGLAAGDQDAASAFVRRFQRRVFGLARTIVSDDRAAEDIAQEAFVRAWKHAGAYDARRGSVVGWLLTITRNLSIDAVRVRRPIAFDPYALLELDAQSAERLPDDLAQLSDDTTRLRAALAQLPEEQCRAVVLAGLLGYTAREVGEMEGIPLGTAKTRIRTALIRLRAALVTEGHDFMNCAEARDLAPELTLGILGGAERAEVILHVNGCARCQANVAEFTEVADALPLLALEGEPSAGFENRVLAALDAPKRSHRRRWIAAVAVAAAAAAIVSITLVRVVESGDGARTAGAPPAANPVVATMVGGSSGQPAGWISVADRRSVTVAVDYGIPAGTYHVQVQPSRGDVATLGAMSVDPTDSGFWAGHSDVPIDSGATIALVDDAGVVTCHGTVGNPQ